MSPHIGYFPTQSPSWILVASGLLGVAAYHEFEIQEQAIWRIVFEGNIGGGHVNLRFNNDSGSNYNRTIHWHGRQAASPIHNFIAGVNQAEIILQAFTMAGNFVADLIITPGIAVTTIARLKGTVFHYEDVNNYLTYDVGGYYDGANPITSFRLIPSAGNMAMFYTLMKGA